MMQAIIIVMLLILAVTWMLIYRLCIQINKIIDEVEGLKEGEPIQYSKYEITEYES